MALDLIKMRREFVRGVTALKLWHAWRLQREEGSDFETVFAKRVKIQAMTVFAPDPASDKAEDAEGWERVLSELRGLYEGRRADTTSASIEAEGLELLSPYLEPCLARDVAVAIKWLEDAVGCFRYEYHTFYPEPDGDDYLTLHFRNAYQPDSPFKHIPEMVESLREIGKRAAVERPDVTWVQCATWVNSVPAYAGLFPQSWTDTSLPGKPGNHTGWWGQFMDRRGGFHAKNAQQFRDTGKFPYQHRMCRCTVTEFNDHLA